MKEFDVLKSVFGEEEGSVCFFHTTLNERIQKVKVTVLREGGVPEWGES